MRACGSLFYIKKIVHNQRAYKYTIVCLNTEGVNTLYIINCVYHSENYFRVFYYYTPGEYMSSNYNMGRANNANLKISTLDRFEKKYDLCCDQSYSLYAFTYTYNTKNSILFSDYSKVLSMLDEKGTIIHYVFEYGKTNKLHIHGYGLFKRNLIYKTMVIKNYNSLWKKCYDAQGWLDYMDKDQSFMTKEYDDDESDESIDIPCTIPIKKLFKN